MGDLRSIAALGALSLGVNPSFGEQSFWKPSLEPVDYLFPPEPPLTKRQRRRLRGKGRSNG